MSMLITSNEQSLFKPYDPWMICFRQIHILLFSNVSSVTLQRFECYVSNVSNVIPNFLTFRLANKDLRNSVTYTKCQQNLLQTEINNKKSRLRTLQNEFNRLCNDLQFTLTCIDFAHISTIFLSSNDNLLKTHHSIQKKKFNKLLTECKPKQDAEKVILNFSNVSLTEAEKSPLVKGLSFSLSPKA